MAVRVRSVTPGNAVLSIFGYFKRSCSTVYSVRRRTLDWIALDFHSTCPILLFYFIIYFVAFWSVRGRRLDVAPPDGSD